MPKGNKLTQWAKREGVLSVAIVVLIVGAAVITALFTLGFIGPEVTSTVTGQVLTDAGEPVSNAAVTLDGQTVGTDVEGRFTFDEVSPGVYELVIEPGGDSSVGAVPPIPLIAEEGEYSVPQSDTVVRGENALSVFLPPLTPVSASTVSANASVDIVYDSPLNAKRGVTLTLRGGDDATSENRLVIKSGETVRVNSFAPPENQRVTVTVPPTERTETYVETYNGPEPIPLVGNLDPSDFRVVFADGDATSVSVNRDRICTEAEVAREGVCVIPDSVVLDDGVTPTVTLGEGGEGVVYEFAYTSRTVADRVVLTVDEDVANQMVIERSEGSPLDSGGWEYSGPVSNGVERGSQEVTVQAVTSVGEVVEGSVVLQFDETGVPPTNPTVTVVNGDGEEFSMAVPDERLEDGELVSTYVSKVPAEWFTAGENTVRVESANGRVLGFEVEAWSTVSQEPVFRGT
jgi:hypothetical protein